MENFGVKKMDMSISDARIKLEGMLAEVMVTGAVDQEPSVFAQIITKLENNELTPADAVSAAQGVIDGRQDYH